MSLLEALPIALLGALLGLDVVSFPQAMVSRPIVSATLAGAFIGNPPAGLLIGVIESVSAYWIGAVYKDIVVYGLFAALLWFRPQGLLGKA